jgi:hypothetical protein
MIHLKVAEIIPKRALIEKTRVNSSIFCLHRIPHAFVSSAVIGCPNSGIVAFLSTAALGVPPCSCWSHPFAILRMQLKRAYRFEITEVNSNTIGAKIV